MRPHALIIAAMLCALPAAAVRADPYGTPRPVSVVDQARYPLLAQGLRSGSFLFSPGLALDQAYDDNIYRSSEDEKSDLITVVRPSFSVSSDFDLHALYASVGAALGYYHDHSGENYQDYNLSAGGRLDVDYETYFTLAGAYRRAHESRDEADAIASAKPVIYSLLTQNIGFTRALGLIKLYVEGSYDRFRFEDSRVGGIIVDNGTRDRDIYTAWGKLAYEYRRGYHIYAATRVDTRRYKESATADERNSTGVETRLGTDMELTGKVKGDIYVGYLERDYEGAQGSIDALGYGGNLVWNVTGLTSVTASLSRSVEETAFVDSTGDLRTRAGLRVDHALRHNMYLGADASYTRSEFSRINAPDEHDDSYAAGIDVEYIPFEGTSIKARYDYIQRDSERAGGGYTANRLSLGLSKKF